MSVYKPQISGVVIPEETSEVISGIRGTTPLTKRGDVIRHDSNPFIQL